MKLNTQQRMKHPQWIGQAFLELVVSLGLFSVVCVWAIPHLYTHLTVRTQRQEQAQIILRQAPWRATHALPALDFELLQEKYGYKAVQNPPKLALQAYEEQEIYALLSPIWRALGSYPGLALETENLYELAIYAPEQEEAWFKFVRLADDWSPHKVEQLTSRPRALTFSQFLQGGIGETIQRYASFLPWGKELHSRELQFGYIAPDVVPESVLCKKEPCS